MACCEKMKIDRMKKIAFATVLTCQECNIRGVEMAVVRKIHPVYGPYYDSMEYSKAKANGFKIFRKFKPGDTLAV